MATRNSTANVSIEVENNQDVTDAEFVVKNISMNYPESFPNLTNPAVHQADIERQCRAVISLQREMLQEQFKRDLSVVEQPALVDKIIKLETELNIARDQLKDQFIWKQAAFLSALRLHNEKIQIYQAYKAMKEAGEREKQLRKLALFSVALSYSQKWQVKRKLQRLLQQQAVELKRVEEHQAYSVSVGELEQIDHQLQDWNKITAELLRLPSRELSIDVCLSALNEVPVLLETHTVQDKV